MEALWAWMDEHEALMWWLGALSVAMFLATLLIIPILAARIPTDYFVREKRPPTAWARAHPVAGLVLAVMRNAVGVAVLLAGVLMLVTPGQGLAAIFIGMLLINFPGKFAFERWLIRKPAVHRGINWLRRRAARQPLQLPDGADP